MRVYKVAVKQRSYQSLVVNSLMIASATSIRYVKPGIAYVNLNDTASSNFTVTL